MILGVFCELCFRLCWFGWKSFHMELDYSIKSYSLSPLAGLGIIFIVCQVEGQLLVYCSFNGIMIGWKLWIVTIHALVSNCCSNIGEKQTNFAITEILSKFEILNLRMKFMENASQHLFVYANKCYMREAFKHYFETRAAHTSHIILQQHQSVGSRIDYELWM